MYELVRQGIIERIGKGKFKIGTNILFVPDISSRIIKINKTIQSNFPFITYCIWSSEWINEFTQHISKAGIIFIDIERDSAESVYYHLKATLKTVFFKPGKEILQDFIQGLENAILIRPLVTEAPVQRIKDVPTISIEKLLVDLFCDNEFEYVQGRELEHIFENAVARFSINQNKLLRYANRKAKKKEITQFLDNLKLPII